MAPMLAAYKTVNTYIEEEVERRSKLTAKRPYRSESINELAEALALSQGEFPPIPYNRTNASWNDDYSDLDIVMKYIRPLLSKNKLALNQWTELTDDGGTILHTELLHASGQWKESRTKVVPVRNDIKTFDSAMADAKRQQALSLLGITLQGDPKDDGGELAMEEAYKEVALPLEKRLVRSEESYECITEEQVRELQIELDGHPDLAEQLLDKYSLRSIGDMPKSKYKYALQQVRKFLMYRKGDTDTIR